MSHTDTTNYYSELILNSLRVFGLSELEALIYVTLLAKGARRAGDLAREMSVHRFDVYNALKTLQSKGAVQATLHRPMVFGAVPLQAILGRVRKEYKEDLNLRNNAMANLEEATTELKRLPMGSEAGLEAGGKIQILTGGHAIFAKYEDLIDETRAEFMCLGTETSLVKWSNSGFLDKVVRRSRSGIDVMLLFPSTDVTSKLLKDLPIKIRRLAAPINGRMLIFDGREVMMAFEEKESTSWKSKDDNAVWMNQNHLAKTQRILFLALWQNSPQM